MRQRRGREVQKQASGAAVSDAELVVAAVRDAEAFTALYQRYSDRLYRYVLGRLGNPSDAADIVSETMLTALEQLERFDPERGTFAGWLFTIATRRIADRGRLHRRFWRAVRRTWKTETPAESAADLLVRREEAEALREALTRLGRDDRELLLLRYGAQLNSTEIGAQLAISPANARVRLQRARQRLALELQQEGIDGAPRSQ